MAATYMGYSFPKNSIGVTPRISGTFRVVERCGYHTPKVVAKFRTRAEAEAFAKAMVQKSIVNS